MLSFSRWNPFRARKAWRMKRRHLRQPCQKPLGFIPAWPRRILWKRTRGPPALWSAVSQLRPGDCQRAAMTRQRPAEPSGRGLPAWSPALRSQKWLKLHKQPGLPGRVTMSAGEGFLPAAGVSSPPCCSGRLWTVCSLWGNLNSLATGKYLNSFKTTGIQQRKGKYPCGASVN